MHHNAGLTLPSIDLQVLFYDARGDLSANSDKGVLPEGVVDRYNTSQRLLNTNSTYTIRCNCAFVSSMFKAFPKVRTTHVVFLGFDICFKLTS